MTNHIPLPVMRGRARALFYSKTGWVKCWKKKGTELVISIEEPYWFEDRVEVKLFAEWPLAK